jgi:hypothetical protein
MTMRAAVVAGVVLLAAGCSSGDGIGPDTSAAEVVAAHVAANPNNVLSAVISAQVRGADSVAVRYRAAGDAAGTVTPAAAPLDDIAVLPVLGLLPDTRYTLQVVAYGAGPAVAGNALDLATGSLPDDLPRYTAGGPDPSPGYVVFAAGAYGLAIDNGGRVVWYHRFPDGPGLNFQAQPNGRYVARPPPANPIQPAPWLELDPLGSVTRTLDCAGGLRPRFHDLLALPDGSYWLLCDETRIMDLSDAGGFADARVTGTVVQHVSDEGALLFQWSAFDHFDVTDLDAADRSGGTVNWTHGNALDLDTEGNLLVSFRNLGEITKIDTRTGEVVWRMGGSRNDFEFTDAPVPPFARQHGLRVTAAGRLLLLDNLGDPAASAARRYEFNATARTARLAAAHAAAPPVTAHLGGTTQDLPGGRTLVSYGNGARVEEYDAGGTVVWRIEGHPGYVFRAQRILSLYRPGVGLPR